LGNYFFRRLVIAVTKFTTEATSAMIAVAIVSPSTHSPFCSFGP